MTSRFDGPRFDEHLTIGRKALAGDFHDVAVGQPQLTHGHFIAGQRSGFIRGDQRATAQPFDRRQSPHNHVASSHPNRGHGQGHGDGHRQSFGNRRDRQRHDEEEGFDQRVTTHRHRQRADDRRRQQRRDRHEIGEPLHPFQQRRLATRAPQNIQSQLSDVRGSAGRDHHSLATAASDHRTGKRHVQSVAKRRRGRALPREILPHGQRFAGQQRLVDLQTLTGQQPNFGRSAIARFQPHDVARHQLFRLDLADLALPQHLRVDAEHLLQSMTALLGLPLLVCGDQRVDRQHRADEPGGLEITDQSGHDRRRHQNVNQRAVKLPHHDQPQRRGSFGRQQIGTEVPQPNRGFRIAQSVLGRVQRSQYVRQHVRMPRPRVL